MITPAFVVFSASRSGSTSLYRALNLIPGTWVAYEPKFDTLPLREDSVFEQVTKLLSGSRNHPATDRSFLSYPCHPSMTIW
jgi:hypothetical protein